MKFADIPHGETVFLDANTLIYQFSSHPMLGPACQELIERIARAELSGFTVFWSVIRTPHAAPVSLK